MCFLLHVDSKPTADKMSVNKSKATFEIEQCWKLKKCIQLETYIYNSIKFYLILSCSSWDLSVDTFMSQRTKGEEY